MIADILEERRVAGVVSANLRSDPILARPDATIEADLVMVSPSADPQ
jgi:hypothetical protein